jgi:hypothetical protein
MLSDTLLLLLVCRLDAARPGFGEMSLLSNITATLGQKVWKQTLVVLTHANGGEGMCVCSSRAWIKLYSNNLAVCVMCSVTAHVGDICRVQK